MNAFKIAALCSCLTLAACSSSQTTDRSPTTDDLLAGAITVSSTPRPLLESLPDVEFNGSSGTTGGSDTGGTSIGDDSADAGRAPTTGSGLDAESADAGVGDGGVTDVDFGDAGFSDAGSSTGGTDAGSGGTTGDVDGALVSDSDASISRPIGLPDVIIDRPDFQAGTLTAADYDDQLNPHLYQRYASSYLQRVGGKLDVPYLDLTKRIGIHVTDASGANFGGVQIELIDPNRSIVSLTTPASGITYIYTDIDTLPEQFTLRATGPFGSALDKTINLSDADESGLIQISMPESQIQQDVTQDQTKLDIMFVIDTTGSMGDELAYIQTELQSIIAGLPFDKGLINLGLTFYRDIGDDYVVRAHGFSNDVSSVQQTLSAEWADGGGDYPEAMDQALHQAIDANWQEGSKRVLFLIADAPPHSNKTRATWNAAEQARIKNIHVVPVAASGVGEDAEYIMRSMAAFTNSRYVFLTDDSGFGNPHATPDIDCYVVTQLNNLMIRVLNSLISGNRHEPGDNEIIRSVGNYNKGVCDQVFTQ